MKHSVAVIPGDSIGKEVVPEALSVLERDGEMWGFNLHHGFARGPARGGHGRPGSALRDQQGLRGGADGTRGGVVDDGTHEADGA